MFTALAVLGLLAAAPACAWDRLAGSHSGIRTRKAIAVTDAEAWRKLWSEHTAGDSAEPLPEVDFEKEMVVAVFLGDRATGGSRVEVQFLERPAGPEEYGTRGPKLYVWYAEASERPGRFRIQVFCQPFELRKVPKAYSQVLIEENRGAEALPAEGDSLPFRPARTGEALRRARASVPPPDFGFSAPTFFDGSR